jgi:hypothetical protein
MGGPKGRDFSSDLPENGNAELFLLGAELQGE